MLPVLGGLAPVQRDPRPVQVWEATMQTQGGQQGSWVVVAVIEVAGQQRQGESDEAGGERWHL